MKDKLSALEKYNFWKGNVPELGYKRLAYTNKIFNYVGNKLQLKLKYILEMKMNLRN